MFQLIQRLGEDVCFQCGRAIESVDDLSVEHKVPWLHADQELFWDLGNIAFSHLRCNIGAKRPTNNKTKNGPARTEWCSRCGRYLPIEAFGTEGRNTWRQGRRYVCTKCRKDKEGWS